MKAHATQVVFVGATLWLSACATPQQNTVSSSSPGLAVAAAATAATLWAAGGGCNLQGCPYGSHCNSESGFCDVSKCEEGCPEDTVCNEGLGLCQAPPPAQAPSDFLPEDDATNRVPGY